MANVTLLHNLLTAHNVLDENLKTELLAVAAWPARVELFLSNALQIDLSPDELSALVRAALSLVQAEEASARGDFGPIIAWLNSSLTDPNLEKGKTVTPLLSDVREILHKAKASSEVWEALVKFEIALFRWLPKIEIEAVLGTQLLPFLRRMEFLPELRRAYLLAVPLYDFGGWTSGFIPVLKKNQERLGKEISLDDKILLPTLANWLNDFEFFTSQPVANVQAFDIVKYASNAPNVKALPASDRDLLVKVIEIYLWSNDPFVLEEDAKALGFLVDNNFPPAVNLPSDSVGIKKEDVEAVSKTAKISKDAAVEVPKSARVPVRQSASVAFPSDINKILNEPELPAPKSELQITDGANADSAQPAKKSLGSQKSLDGVKMAVSAKTSVAKSVAASNAFSPDEKTEWLKSLPVMNDKQIEDLQKLSAKSAQVFVKPDSLPAKFVQPAKLVSRPLAFSSPAPAPQGEGDFEKRQKVSSTATILPSSVVLQEQSPAAKQLKEEDLADMVQTTAVRESDSVGVISSLKEIKKSEDVALLDSAALRQFGEEGLFHALKPLVVEFSWPVLRVDFEQSPLFKAYVDAGSRGLTGESGAGSENDLKQGEFEAVADLLQKLAIIK